MELAKVTRKQLAEWVRWARSRGSFGNGAFEWQLWCPVHAAYLDKIDKYGRHEGLHKFMVYHQPWEHTATVAMVTKALQNHIDPDAEECVLRDL